MAVHLTHCSPRMLTVAFFHITSTASSLHRHPTHPSAAPPRSPPADGVTPTAPTTTTPRAVSPPRCCTMDAGTDLPAHKLVDHLPKPRLYAGEKVISRWAPVKVMLTSDAPPSPCSSPSHSYSPSHSHSPFSPPSPPPPPTCSFAALTVTTCRLVVQPAGGGRRLGIPLQWMRADRLAHKRPFFDAHHVVAGVAPAGMLSGPLLGVGDARHLSLRAEFPNDNARTAALFHHLRNLLLDADFVRRNFQILKLALCASLRPTDTHYAFVNPQAPGVLFLATQMTYPAFIPEGDDDGASSSSSSSSCISCADSDSEVDR